MKKNNSEYFLTYKNWLRKKHPQFSLIRKISIDGGFTCPNLDGSKGRGGCVYCNNNSFSPSAGDRMLKPSEQIVKARHKMDRIFAGAKYIAYFQPFTNTYAPVEQLRDLFYDAIQAEGIVGLSVGTRPDCIGDDVLELLAEIATKVPVTLEIGLQSANDETLKRINRLHSFAEFRDAMNRSNHLGLERSVHVILGLPGESQQDYINTAQSLWEWDIDAVKIHPLHIVRGTELEKWFLAGDYQPLEIEEFTVGAVDFIERTHPDVAIERFTGEAQGDMLVAPDWAGDRIQLLNEINRLFELRGTRQGSLYLKK
jgi:radical SAM protein (TIGR01212 family)